MIHGTRISRFPDPDRKLIPHQLELVTVDSVTDGPNNRSSTGRPSASLRAVYHRTEKTPQVEYVHVKRMRHFI